MNIPAIISKKTLAQLGTSDTHAVRVILHDVHNPSACRLRCRNRQYVFERNGALMAHSLDIPMSVWMEGVGKGRFRDNRAVCDDFRDVSQKHTIHVVTLANVPAASEAGYLNQLRRLLSGLGAPDEVRQAFDLIDSGASSEDFEEFVMGTLSVPAAKPEADETPAQARARKMREAKAAKKAQLQPA